MVSYSHTQGDLNPQPHPQRFMVVEVYIIVGGAIWPKGHWQFQEKLNFSDHLFDKIGPKNTNQLPNKKMVNTQGLLEKRLVKLNL